MKPMARTSTLAATLGALALFCSAGPAMATAELPPVQTSGQIEYLTGGIGTQESAALERASKQWPLTLEFAVKDKPRADFAADVATEIRDAGGHQVLQVTSGGPFILARLAPGTYTVDATFAGRTLHEKVRVRHGQPAKALFLWPAGSQAPRS
ncbi:hypothetical protein ACFPOE_17270 [Caenimonas terrae]|uniref:Carboxypeptidase regulatory-like domain-containing protein n=1 Tax=Caenimonas terrae TaxID=696074 RepID=A0ABW0NK41_9BURK